jgi:branched-chain amino acid transport system permease protein
VRDEGRKGGRLLAGILVVAAAVLVPLYASQYTITTFVRIIYFGFLAMSVGLLIGQGGMISLTQTAFFGLAGYVVGLLGRERRLPFPIPELSAVAAVIVVATIFALMIMRTHRIVFLMITLALGQICWSFARQNTSLLHGWAGIRGIRPFPLAGIDFTQDSFFYWMSLALFLVGLFVMWRVVRSPFGLALKGIRENPLRMRALGYPVYWMRVMVFVIAALYAGIGGILAVYATGIVTPTTMQLSRTIWILLVVILGGANYFWGPVVGTVIAVWLDVIISQMTPRYNTVIGVIFVAVVLLTPNGIMGLLDRTRRALRAASARRRQYAKKRQEDVLAAREGGERK